MSQSLRLRCFAHSWRSDWNHGNAHFLRGLVEELQRLGHDVRCYESEDAWSLVNLLQEPSGNASLEQFSTAFPNCHLYTYNARTLTDLLDVELRDADVVVVHEWNSPDVVRAIRGLRNRRSFRMLLHDTHHRSYTNPHAIQELCPQEFDGILAFGEAVRRIYLEVFGVARAWTFHEAADTTRFHPLPSDSRAEVSWIGNWGDNERSSELEEFVIAPLSTLPPKTAVAYGVRYPERAKRRLQAARIEYRGYLPNLSAPKAYAKSVLTLHVPRRSYTNGLSGIPTIRMFEALACGVPLVCSPWRDAEMLFSPGEDFACVTDGEEMRAEVTALLKDDAARAQLASHALNTIRQRHTCHHRALQFLDICEELGK